MAQIREPGSKAMQVNRAEPRAIVDKLQTAKARSMTLAQRLKQAARAAAPLEATINGKKLTTEGWIESAIPNWPRRC